MQDFNYLSSNDLEVTLEIGCNKYPPATALYQEWLDNKDAMMEYMWQSHLGVKGVVRDSLTGQGVPNAVIHAKNVTRVNDTHVRDDHINHDVTSVHEGDYWRLLTPGTYELTAEAEGYLPLTHTVTVTNPRHSEAVRRDFDLTPIPEALVPQAQDVYEDYPMPQEELPLEEEILGRLRSFNRLRY
ncbi:hypothetical protein C7M84_007422 [Penaeus vannamei]|uniref:Carboxypeptidase E-like n=2 Tax=Penaeus vannamei TaxID=6689 RepID=A0A3R7STB3_PENVA|nr:hypothetical protein C7M84_007422 [Penaeus vannamei]